MSISKFIFPQISEFIFVLLCTRILTRLLEVSDDPQVIAVAAHDVGEYVRHYPRGKRYVTHLALDLQIF